MGRDHGNILSDVSIDLPRPRDRSESAYHSYVDHLTQLLKQALNGTVYTKEDEDIMNFIRNSEHEMKGGAVYRDVGIK